MSRRNSRDFTERMSKARLMLKNMIRRVVPDKTAGGLWGILGYETEDDCEGDGAEPVDVFQGIGIYARPGPDDRSEAVMVLVGGEAQHDALIALRNEDARRRYVDFFGDIKAGEVAIFPSRGDCRIILKQDGTIEIGGLDPQALTTVADAGRLQTFIETHTHAIKGGGAEPTLTPIPPPGIVGTTRFKGE